MYADIGYPAYRRVAERMVESVNFPARQIQFSNSYDCKVGSGEIKVASVTKQNLTLARIEMMKDHAKRFAKNNMVMCDADLIWQNDPAPLFDTNDFDIGLIWRQGNKAMPYCAAMVLVRHGSEAANHFLGKWHLFDLSLPEQEWGWYGDQIALTCMLGPDLKPNTIEVRDGVRIKIFDGGQMIYTVKSEDQKAPAGALAKHYKGQVKHLMVAA